MTDIFRSIWRDISWALNHNKKATALIDKAETEKSVVVFPFYGGDSAKIGGLASKFQFKPTFRPPRKTRQKLHPVKDSLRLRVPGIYRIPFGCGCVYIGQMGRFVMERLSEHARCIHSWHSHEPQWVHY